MAQLGTPAQNDNTLAYNDFRLNGVPVVQGPRRPLTTDKKYPLWTEWRVGKDPSTGSEGEFWKLIKFESNGDATWVMYPTSAGGGALNDLLDQVGTQVTPDVSGFIEIDGVTVDNGVNPSGIPLETVADVGNNTLDVQIQVAADVTGAPADKNDAGICSFDDTQFVVNANGFVQLIGATPPMLSINVDFDTPPGTDPVIADGSGIMQIAGNTVANATNLNAPVATHSRAANAFNIDVQVADAITGAPADNFDAGLSSYNDTQFTVATHGYVSLKGGTDLPSIQTLTGDDSVAVGPDANGDVDLVGLIVPALTNAKPLYFNGDAALKKQTLELQVARKRTGAPANKNDAGICSFDDTVFDVDTNGYVTFVGGGAGVVSIGVDAFTGPGTNPVTPTGGGLITITGGQVATGTIGANVIRTNSLAANTFTIEIQRSTAVAAADSTKNGVSHYDTNNFTVDSNAFVKINNPIISQPYTNIGFTLAGGVFTITDELGVSLSSSNKAFAKMSTINNFGLKTVVSLTKPYRFRDDSNATSDIAGWYPAMNSGDNWNSDRPFFLYVIQHDTPTDDPAIAITLNPTMTAAPGVGNINTSAAKVGQDKNSIFLLDIDNGGFAAPTIANYDGNPCVLIGSFRMKVTTAVTNDWTVTTFDSYDGIGLFQTGRSFQVPAGVKGANAGSIFKDNGGTAPRNGSNFYKYKVHLNGNIECILGYTGVGNAGVGAVSVIGIIPFTPNGVQGGNSCPAGVGTWIDTNLFKQIWPVVPDAGDSRFAVAVRDNLGFILNNGTTSLLLNNQIAGGGADDIRAYFTYRAFAEV